MGFAEKIGANCIFLRKVTKNMPIPALIQQIMARNLHK